jgi:hypothetical protein
MKKIFVVVLLCTTINSFACSICGCGSGNLYMGLFPSFKSKFIGIRYNYSEYHTHLLNSPAQYSHNFYHSTEIWSGINIGQRFQVLAFVPYHYNVQNDDDMGRTTKSGLGDITLVGNYKLFDSRLTQKEASGAVQQLWIGGGVKLPTGSFNVNVADTATTLADINAQIGTGSTDLLLNARHSIETNHFGINTSFNYKITTANAQNYRYGNKLTVNSIVFYKFTKKALNIMPNAGIALESVEGNRLNGSKIYLSEGLNSGSYATGGYALNALAGFELATGAITIGANVQLPVKQDFAAGQTKQNIKAMLHVSFAL